MNVPFVNLLAQHTSLKKEIDDAIHNIIQTSQFIMGEPLRKFEDHFSQFLGAKHTIGVGNGTDALYIALQSLGIMEGDEVLVPSNGFIATPEAVSLTRATPVFVDCADRHFNIDPTKVVEKITPRTKAIIVVHLYGHPAPMDELSTIAQHHNLKIVEDCAQAHGATIHQKMIGTLSPIACFSFFPAKNLGAMGDAGAIVTNDDTLAEYCRKYRNHGRTEKYNHQFEGFNFRMDPLQAAILDVKLFHLASWNQRRNDIAAMYSSGLKDVGDVILPLEPPDSRSVYHLYVCRTKRRDALKAFLHEKEIETGIHYPIGLPFLEAYRRFNHTTSDFPNTYRNQNEVLSLPIFPEMSDSQVDWVIQSVRSFF